MRRSALLLLLASQCAFLGGCAVSEEDRDFYYRGWLFPTDLDREPPSRLRKRGTTEIDRTPAPQYKKDPLIDFD